MSDIDLCECGHTPSQHEEIDNSYAPCTVADCSCEDWQDMTCDYPECDRRKRDREDGSEKTKYYAGYREWTESEWSSEIGPQSPSE